MSNWFSKLTHRSNALKDPSDDGSATSESLSKRMSVDSIITVDGFDYIKFDGDTDGKSTNGDTNGKSTAAVESDFAESFDGPLTKPSASSKLDMVNTEFVSRKEDFLQIKIKDLGYTVLEFGWHFAAIRYFASDSNTEKIPGWRFSFVTFPLEDRKGLSMNYCVYCFEFDQRVHPTPREDFSIVYEHTKPSLPELIDAILYDQAVIKEFGTAIAPFAGPSAPGCIREWLLNIRSKGEPIPRKFYNDGEYERPALHTCGGKVCKRCVYV